MFLTRWMNYFGQPVIVKYVNTFAIAYVIAILILATFIPSTILRDSDIAKNVVAVSSVVFPWLQNIQEAFGESGERGTVIHSFVYLSSAIPAALLALANRPKKGSVEEMLIGLRDFSSILSGFGAIGMVIIGYLFLGGRIGYFEKAGFINPVGAAVTAIGGAALFWDGVARLVMAISSYGIKKN